MGVDRGDMTTPHRSSQGDLARRRNRCRDDTEDILAAGQHVGVDHIGLRSSNNRLTEPGRVPIRHEPDIASGVGHRVRQRQPRASRRFRHNQRTRIGFEPL